MKREIGTLIVGKTKFQVNDYKSPYFGKIGVLAKELSPEFYNYEDSWVLLDIESIGVKSMNISKINKIYEENIGKHIIFTDGPYIGSEAIVTREDKEMIYFDCLPDQGIPDYSMKGSLSKIHKPLTWEFI